MNDDVVSLKEYFDSILEEREKRLLERAHAQDEAIKKSEDNLDRELHGFPESYARSDTVENLRKTIEDIKSDHVQRRELDEIKAAESVAAGRRSVVLVLATVAATAAFTTTGYLITDRNNVDSQIRQLQERDHAAQITILKIQDELHSHETQDKFKK